MSLDWSLENIKDWEAVCTVPSRKNEDEREMKPITETLIHLTMFVGMHEITEQNWQKFWERVSSRERLLGYNLRYADTFQPFGDDAVSDLYKAVSKLSGKWVVSITQNTNDQGQTTWTLVYSVPISMQDIKDHIGLHTNAANKSDHVFWKGIREAREYDVVQEVAAFERMQENKPTID